MERRGRHCDVAADCGGDSPSIHTLVKKNDHQYHDICDRSDSLACEYRLWLEFEIFSV